jgi:hypothetical protein
MKAIEGHEVIVHGVEHSQYFQGCGVSFTPFEDVATGIGCDAAEAFDDALESLAQGDWEVEGADEWDDKPKADDARLSEDDHEEMHVYVSVRVKGRAILSPEEIKDKYAARIVAILNNVVSDIREEDDSLVISEVYDMHCDDFRWTFNVHRAEDTEASKTDPQGVDVTFVICESEEYDGEKNGANFAVEIVGVGGEIVGGITPYNYTDQCWVSRLDPDAIEERFQLVETAPAYEAAQLVTEFLGRQ